MTDARKYPVFTPETSVPCYHCGAPTDAASRVDTGFPPGGGQYRQTCRQGGCGVYTYFDVTKVPHATQ